MRRENKNFNNKLKKLGDCLFLHKYFTSKQKVKGYIFLVFLFLFLILNGCNKLEKNKMNWFKTPDEAIQYGLKEEKIGEEDIIGKLKLNGEQFIVFKKEENSKSLVGLSNIAKKEKKYQWYRSNAYTEVDDHDIRISFVTKTLSKKKFDFYLGKVKGKEFTIETNLGEVTPKIDKKTNIYYFISPK